MNAIRVAATRAVQLTAVQFRAAGTKEPVNAKVAAAKAVAAEAPITAKKVAAAKAVAAEAPITAKKVAATKDVAANAPISAKKVIPTGKKKPTNPYVLFVKKVATGTKGKVNYKAIAAQWKGLSDAEKKSFREEAKKNAAENAAKPGGKGKASKYALFTKEHFAAAYAAALKKTDVPKEAFFLASKEISAKYKAQK